MRRLGELEEQYDGLQRYHSETEFELANTKASLNDRKVFCEQLQDDCDSMTKRVSSWAGDQRSAWWGVGYNQGIPILGLRVPVTTLGP